MNNCESELTLLKLSIQRALLGEVTDRLISVTCGLKDRHIEIKAYLSGEPTEEDFERIGSVAGEVVADFPDGYTIAESCLSATNEKEEMLDFWALRKKTT